jgi:uncharacterized protein (DUF3084 family)
MNAKQRRAAGSNARARQAAAQPAAAPMTEEQITRAAALLGNLHEASKYLSEQEREALDRAQQSVVEARRQADLQAGHLRVL